MKRTICVEEANEVEIVFKDRTYLATFNMVSVKYMQEEIQKCGLKNLPYEHFAALALYSGIKVNHPDFTVEEANALALTMRPSDMALIINEYTHSINGASVQENEEELKKVIAQILGGKLQ